MGRLERGDDPLELRAKLEGVERLLVGHGDVVHAAAILEPGMFGTDARVVEAGGDGMALEDLPVIVLEEIGAIAVQHAGPSAGHRGGMTVRDIEAVAAGFDPIDRDRWLIEEGMEQAHRVRAAADAGDERVGQPPFPLQHLLACLAPDHRLEVAHHGGIGMRARHRADDVEGVVHVGDPVAKRVVHGVLQRARTRRDRTDLGAEKFHAKHVRPLPLDVGRAHVDDARKAEARRDRRHRDAMLSGAGLGDDPRLAHAAGDLDLAEAVVDLVRPGVVQLVALEVDLGAAELAGKTLGEIERARAAGVMGEKIVKLGLEGGIGLGLGISAFEIEDERHQRLGDVASAIEAEMAALVGPGAIGVERIVLVARAHDAFALCCSPALLAARMKQVTRSGSFSPGARSTPEDTSTSAAPVMAMAAATVSGVRPPDSANGAPKPCSACQSKATPLPPGSSAAASALASNKMPSATAA